eukprot:TRINITY_DN17733_c0_g1_i2.p4 TRINITY_DN17733_c0_g1~~TRINITY_DN17733_c0_g1_i2.p4  ORF type:complete len:132 (+),score=3.74 TRINITY_DN17733_c0_g1_i2:334-729(+)
MLISDRFGCAIIANSCNKLFFKFLGKLHEFFKIIIVIEKVVITLVIKIFKDIQDIVISTFSYVTLNLQQLNMQSRILGVPCKRKKHKPKHMLIEIGQSQPTIARPSTVWFETLKVSVILKLHYSTHQFQIC